MNTIVTIARVISKNRDSKGKIIDYTIQEDLGSQYNLTAQEIKNYIQEDSIRFLNLKLNKSGRLVDKAEPKGLETVNKMIYAYDRFVCGEDERLSLPEDAKELWDELFDDMKQQALNSKCILHIEEKEIIIEACELPKSIVSLYKEVKDYVKYKILLCDVIKAIFKEVATENDKKIARFEIAEIRGIFEMPWERRIITANEVELYEFIGNELEKFSNAMRKPIRILVEDEDCSIDANLTGYTMFIQWLMNRENKNSDYYRYRALQAIKKKIGYLKNNCQGELEEYIRNIYEACAWIEFNYGVYGKCYLIDQYGKMDDVKIIDYTVKQFASTLRDEESIT